ncbi:DUF2236 domain-containing protein [Corallococcus sp. M34]|uniref:oxygenase MpaB family protein n=1 Tax=Citreicoccus inhibens TaxID=2849499 RepID=UPI001C21A2D8|nr:oxygenase MpaB family protein [Citreicoccus inhibens]MBU8898418.1 DUF2236 domain-containing protein [Citreicoccus inhibens]
MPPPFLVRGQDVSHLLHTALPAHDSLYSAMYSAQQQLMFSLRQHWDTAHQGSTPLTGAPSYRPSVSAFAALEGWWGTSYGDRELARALFNSARAADVANIVGHPTADAFADAFEAARDEAFYVFAQVPSVNTLNGFSFKATYLHRDIETLFARLPHFQNPTVLRYRVMETARVMLRILWGNMNGVWRSLYQKRSLLTTLLLGMMHNRLLKQYMNAGRPLYNQSGVAFTLLTFSYVPAQVWRDKQQNQPQGYAFDEARWYYFWRIFGSLLGLSAALIPHDHDEAEEMWYWFFANGECRGNPHDLTRTQPGFRQLNPALHNAFNASNRVQPDNWTALDLATFLPAWLVTQLRSTPRWFRYFRGQ